MESVSSNRLTEAEKADLFQALGHPLEDHYIPVAQARLYLSSLESDAQRGKRYALRVWSKYDLPEYLDAQAKQCANFGRDLTGKVSRTYYVANPHGGRSIVRALGKIQFRDFSWCLSRVGLAPEEKKSCVTIEAIELHPSLRRQGFLRRVMQEFKRLGFKAIGISVVGNPALAYHLFRRSLESNRVVVMSDPKTVDFERNISPCPSFAVLL